MRSINRDRAVSIFEELKATKPKKWADMVGQFRSMASGSSGPWLIGGYPRVRVRQHYYGSWSDDDFAWVLSQVTGSD